MWGLGSKGIGSKINMMKQNLRPRGDNDNAVKLECPICWEPLDVVENVPYVLWCGHTVCKNCVVGLPRAVLKIPWKPIQLPFFISCPWCTLLCLRLVCKGNVKLPCKNFFLLCMIESCMSTDGSKSPVDDEANKDISKDVDGWLEGRLRSFLRRSYHVLAQVTPTLTVIIISVVLALQGVPLRAAMLALHGLVSFLLLFPCFFILYFSFPALAMLMREMLTCN